MSAWRPSTVSLAWMVTFVAFGVFATWPLALHPASSIQAGAFGGQHLLILESARRSGGVELFQGWSWALGYPTGGAVVLLDWPALALHVVLAPVFGAAATFNLLEALRIGVAGLATAAFARAHGTSAWGAGAAALLYAFSPYAHSIVFIGEVPNLWHGLLPLTLLACRAALRPGATAGLVAAPILLGAGFLATPYYGVFFALAAGAYTAALAWHAPDRSPALVRAAVVGVIGAGLLVPLHHYFGRLEAIPEPWHLWLPARGSPPDATRDIDLLHSTLRSLLRPGKVAVGQESIQVSFLGFTPLVLAAVGLWTGRRRVRGWAALTGLGVLLALGTRLRLSIGTSDGPLLPFGLLQAVVPALDSVWATYRAIPIAALGLALLAAVAVDTRRWLAAAAVVGLGLDLAVWSPTPWPMRPETLTLPAPLAAIAADPVPRGVWAFPHECYPIADRGSYRRMWARLALLGKPLGNLDRYRDDRTTTTLGTPQPPESALDTGLCSLLYGREPAYPPDPAGWGRAGFGWLVVDGNLVPPAPLLAIRQWLMMSLGAPEEGGGFAVWTLGRGPAAPLAPPEALR